MLYLWPFITMAVIATELLDRMSHRKWRKTKLKLI